MMACRIPREAFLTCSIPPRHGGSLHLGPPMKPKPRILATEWWRLWLLGRGGLLVTCFLGS